MQIAQYTPDVTLQSAAAATGNGTALSLAGFPVAIFTVTISNTATITWEASADGGTTYVGVYAADIGGSIALTATASSIYRVNCAGCTHVRARISAWTSGTVTVTGHASAFDGSTVAQTSVTLAANQSVNVAQINGVTPLMGNGVTGTGSPRVTVASDNTPFAVKTDQTTHGTTDLVAADITKLAGTAAVNGGTAGVFSVGGPNATNVAIGSNPVNSGAQAVSSENTAVTTGRMVQLVADLVGKLIVLPYSNPENLVTGTTGAITDTTSTSVIASAGGSLRNYITQITVGNSHATVGTFVKITDGSGGSILWEGYCAAVGGGCCITFPSPLRGSAATAVHAVCVTTGANVIASVSGYKGV